MLKTQLKMLGKSTQLKTSLECLGKQTRNRRGNVDIINARLFLAELPYAVEVAQNCHNVKVRFPGMVLSQATSNKLPLNTLNGVPARRNGTN